ncbi:MAG: efflux RND transporter permease subunit [Myxococcales bacterium]|nr:efflux RND transporter permease subunit [Myxococcales bacterium]
MKRAISWFAENHVAANLLMCLLIIGGLVVLPGLPQKSFPDIDIEMITVAVEYRGAAPEEVELGVCIRIEEAIDGVVGIEEIRSTAAEGACAVVVELSSGVDVNRALDDIKNRVDGIDTFPEDTEKPIVSQVTIQRAVVDLAVTGPVGERTLKRVAQRVRDEIAALPGVTQVELLSVRPYEISIEVPEASLRRHELTFDQVANAVRRSSLDLPGGSIKTEGGEILLRTKGQAYSGREFEKLVVITRGDGTRVTLEDIAQVVDGFEDTDQWAEFDGRPSAMVRVFRVGQQDILEVAQSVRDYVSRARAQLPPGVELTLWRDDSQLLRDRLDTLLRSGRTGYAFVLVVLAVFLRARLAFWISLGVPISFLGALWMFPALGLSIDGISLFGFILVLGILVDDAIVVGESVHSEQTRTGERLEASIRGTHRVATPVVYGVLTTVAAFAPMLLVSGMMGQIFSVISTVVIMCLLFSLLESQLILPAHLGHRSQLAERVGQSFRTFFAASFWALPLGRIASAREWVATGLERFAHGPYRSLLGRALEWRYTTAAVGIACLLCAGAVVGSGRLSFSFFPPVQADYVTAALTMPQGIPAEATSGAVRQIERAVGRLREEIDPIYAPAGSSLVRHVLSAVGEQPSLEAASNNPQTVGRQANRGAHLGEVTLELVSSEQRSIPTNEVALRWREITGPVPDAVELSFSSSLFSVGEEINLQLRGPRVSELQEAADRLKAKLASYPGVLDITDSFRSGKREVKLQILPSAEALGLTLQDLARQVRQAFYGEEAQRIQRERDDVRVMVRYPLRDRRSLGDLEFMRIRAPDGSEVPFGTVARADPGRGFATIRRTDRQRVVNVTADVDRTQVTANEVLASLEAGSLQEILADYPDVSYSLEGAQRQQRRALGSLLRWYPVALFCIYALLAIPLRSYLQPLIIMAVIPFSLVGAVLGHLLFGKGLSFMSVMGLVAASGVVVNSSLLLVHHVNQRRQQGDPLHTAIETASVARLRPIVLTALTTFVGLLPLMLNRSVQAQLLVPMGISLAFGVAVATLVTLLIVPSGYLMIEDLRAKWGRA